MAFPDRTSGLSVALTVNFPTPAAIVVPVSLMTPSKLWVAVLVVTR